MFEYTIPETKRAGTPTERSMEMNKLVNSSQTPFLFCNTQLLFCTTSAVNVDKLYSKSAGAGFLHLKETYLFCSISAEGVACGLRLFTWRWPLSFGKKLISA